MHANPVNGKSAVHLKDSPRSGWSYYANGKEGLIRIDPIDGCEATRIEEEKEKPKSRTAPLKPKGAAPRTVSSHQACATRLFYVRTSDSVNSATIELRREAQAADAAIPVFDVTSLDESIAASLFTQRISAGLQSVVSSVAVLLAAIGLYGVMSYSVTQRTNEIGIRIALGAQRSHVLRLVLGQGARLAGIGVITGVLASLAVMRLLIGALYGVSAADPMTIVGAAMLLTFIALAACYIPARRAMRLDPMAALRYE